MNTRSMMPHQNRESESELCAITELWSVIQRFKDTIANMSKSSDMSVNKDCEDHPSSDKDGPQPLATKKALGTN